TKANPKNAVSGNESAYWNTTKWLVQSGTKYQTTYDAMNRMTINIRLDWNKSLSRYENAQKDVFSDFGTFITGVKEVQEHSSFRIYPNPVLNTVYIKTNNIENDTKIIITDITGREIMNTSSVSAIDVSGLRSGVYFMTVKTLNSIHQTKFIKH
ncbi:MAG: T9SS type A sorting domain-containing protein, partial [Bacteroidetes bacterium]|nr:T9SS type A sorting domain-containing protein [Bacteroidota bacterium]